MSSQVCLLSPFLWNLVGAGGASCGDGASWARGCGEGNWGEDGTSRNGGKTWGRDGLTGSRWGGVEVGLLEGAGPGQRWGSLRSGLQDAQLACSKALLQSHALRIQLLGKQMNSLQRVPTALGVHKSAACRDFDWERRERGTAGPQERGWKRGVTQRRHGRGLRSEVGGCPPCPEPGPDHSQWKYSSSSSWAS